MYKGSPEWFDLMEEKINELQEIKKEAELAAKDRELTHDEMCDISDIIDDIEKHMEQMLEEKEKLNRCPDCFHGCNSCLMLSY